MSIAQTVLFYVGIPAAVIAIVAVLIYAGGSRRAKRYRPGRPYDFQPVWFTAAPSSAAGAAGRHELPSAQGADSPAALPAATETVTEGRTGGASDRW